LENGVNHDGAPGPLAGLRDDGLLDLVADLWRRHDPAPADLADRISFVLGLDDLEVELMRVTEQTLSLAGARAEDRARTITFSSDTLSVMVMINEGPAGVVRLDGWIDGGGGLGVGLRIDGAERSTSADADGRFSFEAVPAGLTQLVFHPARGAQARLRRSVVTPAIKI
jgi:hypothetical protein